MKLLLALPLCLLALNLPALPAFPGAEGFGANATGGRGGDVYYVTNLADTGPGSLRHGISSARGPRTILFKVSGNIELQSSFNVNQPNITIAGQTAPGDGVCVQNYTFGIRANDIIVRHIRTRLGTNAMEQSDAMSITGGTNIIVDHCSASWSVDETLSPTDSAQNLTVQWTFITESLNHSIHSKGDHGYGSLMRVKQDANFTFHHDLYAHHSSRNPRPGTYKNAHLLLDFRYNLIYDWGYKAGYDNFTNENVDLNYVGNCLLAGPATTQLLHAFEGSSVTTRIFQDGNYMDANKNGRLDGTNSGWAMIGDLFTRQNHPFPAPAVTTDSATTAYARVLAFAGATPWQRDAVDARVADSVRHESGGIIDTTAQVGGWPKLNSTVPPEDSDADGMPDDWETALGLNPHDAGDHNAIAASGYTQLEEYLNWLAAPHATAARNTPVDINLQTLCGNSSGLTFIANHATNGQVTIATDGRTAIFTPQQDFRGLAGFQFTAVNAASGIGFGPVTIGILVTK